MNFEEFKEKFIENVKQVLKQDGIEAAFTIHGVKKINEAYEAVTVTPEGSKIGVNVNMNQFFAKYEDGVDYDEIIDKAVDVIETALRMSQRLIFLL